jgi:hypothetical protein
VGGMTRLPAWTPFALGLALLMGAGGCASEEAAKPPVCDSFAAVQNTVDHIRDVNVSENGLTQLKPYLTQLREDFTQLYNDAKAQYAPQAEQLRTALTQLGTDLGAAQADPGAATLAAVRTSVQGVRTSAQNLRAALAKTC